MSWSLFTDNCLIEVTAWKGLTIDIFLICLIWTKYRPFPFCSIKIEAIHLGWWVDECFNVVDPWQFRTVITNWSMKPPPLLRVGVWKLLTLEGYGYQDMSLCYWCSAWGHGSTTLKHSSTHHPRCIASILIEQKGNGLYFVIPFQH
jgi:hypothetical protein